MDPKCENNSPRVAVLFFRLGPYHYARIKAASSVLRISAVEFSDVDPTYAWDAIPGQDGFDRVLLFSGDSVESQSTSHIFEAMDRTLSALDPNAVAIPGWHDRCSIVALRWCILHKVPVILMSESTAWDDKRKPWRELVKKRVVRLGSAGLVGGQGHADYLAQLGLDHDRAFSGYDAVDNHYFAEKAAEIRSQASAVRVQHGLPERYFLASARFVEKKNLMRLVQAYARYRALYEDQRPKAAAPAPWSLVLLGEGALKSDLCHRVSDLALQDSVLLPGFKQYHELPVYYALASAFIHTSTTEQWGLVVNEAMASGLPVLVSNRCGCARDLVRDGVNGFTFDPYNQEQIAKLMLKISAADFPQAEFGLASQRIVAEWGPERFANGLQQAVGCALRVGPVKPTLMDRLLLQLLSETRNGAFNAKAA